MLVASMLLSSPSRPHLPFSCSISFSEALRVVKEKDTLGARKVHFFLCLRSYLCGCSKLYFVSTICSTSDAKHFVFG
jgi:hypothetical protein